MKGGNRKEGGGERKGGNKTEGRGRGMDKRSKWW